MANVTILQLPKVSGLTGTEQIEGVQNNASVRMTVSDIAALGPLGPTGPMGPTGPPGVVFPTTPSLISVNSFGIFSSATIDWTSQIITAQAAAAAAGQDLYFPPGLYIYSGTINNTVSWIGSGSAITELRKVTALGKGAAINTNNVNGVTFQGIGFTCPNTPSNATNDATNADMMLAFYTCSNVNVLDCTWKNSYGVNCYFEYVTTGRIANCRVYTCYKDGFPVDRGSSDVELINCLVEDGGDDCFPVVGYVGDTSRPTNITHIGCVVRGSKFANAFKYAGAICCQNIGCKVDGTIPASYGRTTAQQSCPAMNILVDSTANTYGNEDLQITGFQAINCGRGASPFPGVTRAVQVGGAAGKITRNIRFTNITVKNSASAAFLADGGVAGGIENLEINGINAIDTSDANGYTATAGTAKFEGINIRNTHNFKMAGSLSDTGGTGCILDVSNTGLFDLELKSYRINKGSAPTTCRIIDTVNSGSTIQRLRLKLTVCEQASASSGSQYFLSNPIWFNTRGMMESIQVEYDKSAPTQNFIFGLLLTGQAIGSSPWTYTNTSGMKQVFQPQIGTAAGVTFARGNAAPGGSVSFGPAFPVTGTSFFDMVLAPGESVQTTYTTVGTMVIAVGPAEGI